MIKLGNRSNENISNIDTRLAVIIGAVLSKCNVDFTITQGFRTVEYQKSLYAQGRTKKGNIVTYCDGVKKKSRHQSGKAIDFIPYPFKGWDDIEGFKKVGNELERVGKLLGYNCSYGGNWTKFKDYPHFEIK